jgi:hypothetical protein
MNALRGTSGNKGKAKGWAQGKPTRATRERRRSCSEKVETYPTITIASGDESTMNVTEEAGFFEPLTRCELRRIHLLRRSVNRAAHHDDIPVTRAHPHRPTTVRAGFRRPPETRAARQARSGLPTAPSSSTWSGYLVCLPSSTKVASLRCFYCSWA